MSSKRIMMIGDPFAPLFGSPTVAPSPTSIGGTDPKTQWSRDATGQAFYEVQPGDSLQAIALRWLGDGQKWKQLWDFQPPAFKDAHRNDPNLLRIGDRLAMPLTATVKAESLGFLSPYAKRTGSDGSVTYTLPTIEIRANETKPPATAPNYDAFPATPPPAPTTAPPPPVTTTSAPSSPGFGTLSPTTWMLLAGGAAIGAVLLYRQRTGTGSYRRAYA